MNFIEVNIENRIATIALNRPDKRNALNAVVVTELKQALADCNNNSVKAIVLKGNGEAFCAGADLAYLKSLQTNTFEENLADSQHLKDLFDTIYHYPKVVVAMVTGHAIAGGAGLATVCDFTFSVPEAKIGYTEVNIGFVPAIVSVFLIKKIGEAKARELLLTGKLIYATKAAEINLINEVYSAEEIEQKTYSFVQKLITRTSGDSIALTKQLIADVQSMSIKDAFNHAAEINAKARATDDCQKGIAGFLNKEKVTW